MGEYTVTDSSFKREFEGKYGKTHVYRLALTQGDERFQNVEVLQKPETAAPKQGDVLSGSLKETEYGLKFLKDKPAIGGFVPRAEDPKRAAAILRQHSQHMALLYVQNMAVDKRPQSWGEFWAIVDKFDNDVQMVKEKAA